jgi:hypothetical protein
LFMIDRVLPSMSATITITAATGEFIATSLRLVLQPAPCLPQ